MCIPFSWYNDATVLALDPIHLTSERSYINCTDQRISIKLIHSLHSHFKTGTPPRGSYEAIRNLDT